MHMLHKNSQGLASFTCFVYLRGMRYLSLAALQVGLADLFAHRHTDLVASKTGTMYEPILLERKSVVDGLPEATGAGKPFADALTDADSRHDGFGAALWHFTEAYLCWPDISADVRGAIERVRAAFIPQIDLLQASYVNESKAAIDNKNDLVKLEKDLKSIPIAGGLSLYDWCAGFVGAGESIAKLLSERADADTGARSLAGKIRTSTISILGRFRAALADEIATNKALPADLDARVFGYFDELNGMRADAVAAAHHRAHATQPAPAPQSTAQKTG